MKYFEFLTVKIYERQIIIKYQKKDFYQPTGSSLNNNKELKEVYYREHHSIEDVTKSKN